VTSDAKTLAARIIQDAGGELVGRTRLQKVAFLLSLAGFENSFRFEYRHYGPFSEDLADAVEIASVLGPIREEERVADWGGRYSIYTLGQDVAPRDEKRSAFVQKAKDINAVELELAATAAYLFMHEGIGRHVPGNPWHETARRKPTKAADGRLERALAAYNELRAIPANQQLPELPGL
jgi:uncharacterized protein YwgA